MKKPVSGRGRSFSPPPLSKAPAGKPKASPRKKKKTDKRGAKKGSFGNTPFVPTAEQRIQVEAYVAAGAEQELIAEYTGLSEDTLQRHFRSELDHGKARALTKIGGSMIKRALDGDADLGKFVMARIGGWKAATAVENTGPNGGPMEYRNLSEEEIDARIGALLREHDTPGAKRSGKARTPRAAGRTGSSGARKAAG